MCAVNIFVQQALRTRDNGGPSSAHTCHAQKEDGFRKAREKLDIKGLKRHVCRLAFNKFTVFLHVTCGAVMTPVRLDHLTTVTIPDRCNISTQQDLVMGQLRYTRTYETHASDTQTYLRLLCGCTSADWRRLSTGSLAGSRASLPSRSSPSQLWAGRTGVEKTNEKTSGRF